MGADVVVMVNQGLLECFARPCGHVFQPWDAVDGRNGQVEAIKPVEHAHIEGRGCGAFFLVAVDVEVLVIRPAINQSVNQPWVAVIGEDHGGIGGEEGIEVAI